MPIAGTKALAIFAILLIPPTITNVMVNNNLLTAEVYDGTSVDLMATISEYNSKFQSFVMLDDGTNGDVMANDGIYSSALPFQSSGLNIKFYISSHALRRSARYVTPFWNTDTNIFP